MCLFGRRPCTSCSTFSGSTKADSDRRYWFLHIRRSRKLPCQSIKILRSPWRHFASSYSVLPHLHPSSHSYLLLSPDCTEVDAFLWYFVQLLLLLLRTTITSIREYFVDCGLENSFLEIEYTQTAYQQKQHQPKE